MNQEKLVWVEWKNFGDCRSFFSINGKEVQGVFSSQGLSTVQQSRLVVDLMEVEQ